MASPSSSLATLRPDLAGSFTAFDLEADQKGFIALSVLPSIDVKKPAGTFGKIPITELLKQRSTTRAPGAPYNRGEWNFTPDTYSCTEQGAEEPVDDSEAEIYSEFFVAEQVATARARDAVLRNQELRAAAAVFNTTTWTGASLTTAVGTAWSNIASVPLTDVEAAVQKVFDNSGLWPNALILNRKTFRNLRNVTQIIDRIKYAGIMDPRAGAISAEALAQAFDLKYVIVAGGAKDNANEGQAASIAQIWGQFAMVGRVAETSDIREPCIGRIFHYGEDGSQMGGTVETYREEQTRSNIVRCRHHVGEKILYAQAGHLLSGV